ncbi:MAG: endolytic transglycosylase MltG [Eubacterium sp.]|nr:endolytic transglycosylase MltG [Eubacterium sp.]
MFEKISGAVIRLLFLIFFILLSVLAFNEARKIGYAVFADQAYDNSASATESLITVTEGESLLNIAKDLERTGIVKNARITALSFRTMEGYDRIKPGEYILRASMKPSQIMEIITRAEDEES